MAVLFPYSARTAGIVVRVSVSFLSDQSEPASDRWFWAYHIRLENQGQQEVQLLTRRWVIIDGRGARHLVEGEGVVGEQPVIAPGQSYDYVSGCPLDTPTGSMEGSYQMIGADGALFNVAIPRFSLIGPEDSR
ncbi:Co2+/Mg2+ efflux protein ApaG [Sphingomonas crusticola]|uniref:Co2+/Mg2+ efflux protein ApaG n=1 Tax=Sphingomonas crusticola TaxID=1697973 RepID=UPI000E24E246|nr:Co2+/Mg2+ efflux protein ApaG [Sphingomonas crusticola]